MDLAIGVHSMAPAGGTELNVFQVDARAGPTRGTPSIWSGGATGALAAEYRSFCRSVTRRPVFDFARLERAA